MVVLVDEVVVDVLGPLVDVVDVPERVVDVVVPGTDVVVAVVPGTDVVDVPVPTRSMVNEEEAGVPQAHTVIVPLACVESGHGRSVVPVASML